MPRLKVPGANLHYQVYGEGAPITFLHGSGGNHLSWWQQVPLLRQHYRCLLLDLRGYGHSLCDAPPTGEHVFSDDLRALLDHLNISSTHLVGQSIGGHYALRFALDHPPRVASLVLAATLAGIAHKDIATAKAAAGPVPENLLERALGARFRAQQPNLAFLYEMIECLNHAAGAPNTLVPTDIDTAKLGNLGIPALFLVGEHDPVAPPVAVEVASRLVAGAKYKLIPDCGHSAYFERPAAFNAALLEFLGELG